MSYELRQPARDLRRVVLCESFDQRVLKAAHVLNQHQLARVLLLGNRDELERAAVGYRTSLEGMEVIDYETAATQESIGPYVSELDPKGDLDPADPVVAGAWMVGTGSADAVIAGAATKPSHVMRVFLRLLGVAEGCKAVSGMSLIVFENREFIRNQVIGMADVSVVPEPTAEQLADIAMQSAPNYERMTGNPARVAFLSFSTLGSSDHPAVETVREAVRLTHSRRPDLAVDGEMQIDAALIPSVAGVKAPSSSVAGNANVLIFPCLAAGNITVKILQRFSNCRVLGPMLQGLAHRGTYIARAASADEIVDQVRLLTT